MATLMNKETWIKSRTNNPNKLGESVWSSYYDLIVQEIQGRKIPVVAKAVLRPLHIQMAQEYLNKLGIFIKVNDSNFTQIVPFMENLDSIQDSKAIALGLNHVLRISKKPTERKFWFGPKGER